MKVALSALSCLIDHLELLKLKVPGKQHVATLLHRDGGWLLTLLCVVLHGHDTHIR